ncbi:hypothetical protein HK098_006292, partial [Nowakowskiella sp. JEL0407]
VPIAAKSATALIVSTSIQTPRFCIGREEVLELISSTLSDVNKSAAVAIHGGPGMGKTTVVSDYISKLRMNRDSHYTHVLWMSFVSENAFMESVNQVNELLNFPKESDFDKVRATVFNYLTTNQRYLLFMENADDSDFFMQCLEGLARLTGHVIITSRNSAINVQISLGIRHRDVVHHEISGWKESTARDYVITRLQLFVISESEKKELDNILRFMSGHPLAIEQMCSFLSSVKSCNFSDYSKMLKTVGASQSQNPIDAAFEIALEYLLYKDQVASCVLLGALSCVAHRTIPIAYLSRFLFTAGYRSINIDKALSSLIEMSLVSLDTDTKSTISIHLAVQEIVARSLSAEWTEDSDKLSVFVKKKAPGETCEEWFNMSILVINELLPVERNKNYDPKSIVEGKLYLPHVAKLACTQKPSMDLANLSLKAASFAKYISQFNVAKSLYTCILAMFLEIHGTRLHANVANTINNIGDVAKYQGDYDEARKLYTKSLSIFEKVHGTREHVDVATALFNLGSIADSQEDYDEAKKLYLESLHIYENVYGANDHAEIATAINNIGSIEDTQGNHDEARRLFLKSLYIYEVVYGTRDHADVAMTLINLGSIAKRLGKFDEAKRYYSESLKIQEKVHGNTENADVAAIINNLGSIEDSQGNYEEAKKLYLKSRNIYEKIYRTREHIDVATTIENLGLIAITQGRYEEAEKLYMESLSIYERVYGTREHADVAMSLKSLGLIAMKQGNFEEAKTYNLRSLSIFEDVYGTREHVDVAATINNLGSIAMQEGDYEEAKIQYLKSLVIYEKVYQSRVHSDVAETINNLGLIATNQGDFNEARKLYLECLDIEGKLYGTREHASSAVTIYNLGLISHQQGDFKEARRLYMESLAILEVTLKNKKHPDYRRISKALKVVEGDMKLTV